VVDNKPVEIKGGLMDHLPGRLLRDIERNIVIGIIPIPKSIKMRIEAVTFITAMGIGNYLFLFRIELK